MSELELSVVVAGHGVPMRGERLRRRLAEVARDFDRLAVPNQGRYVPDRPTDVAWDNEQHQP